MNRWYVGIDAGGSKTAAVALSQVGAVLGRARAGSGSLTTQPPAAVAAVFAMALSEAAREAGFDAAAEPPSAAMVGIAGFSNESGRIELQTRLASAWPKTSWYVVPDYVTAWYGASGGTPSACVIAGTGSVAYGRNDAGDEVRLDGLGYLLGDVGGAVKLVLDAILNNLDLPAGDSPTSLGRAMMLEAGVTLAADIIPWVYADFSPARVAALAPLIGRLADAGDPHAIRVIRRHGFRLRRLALQTVQRLQFRHEAPVFPAGGLWACSRHLRDAFAHGSRAESSGLARRGATASITIQQPIADAAMGAAQMAREQETAQPPRTV